MQGHHPVYQFTKIIGKKKLDVFKCECGVVGYRRAGTEDPPGRDPSRFKAPKYATCEGKRKADTQRKNFFPGF